MSKLELGVVIALLIFFVAGFAMVLNSWRRRTGKLRARFGGAEYDLALKAGGKKRQAESALDQRAARVARFHVQPLGSADRARFEESWRKVQARFVDGPAGAVAEADQLLGDVMATRGYPVSDFEQRAADISVDHPAVMASYRTAHAIATRQAQGQSNTEELRQAMIHYRTLFAELVGELDAAA